MTPLIISAIVIVWFVCGYFAMGYVFAYFQREYPTIAEETRDDDVYMAYEAFVLGPISLLGSLGRTQKHGRLYPWEIEP